MKRQKHRPVMTKAPPETSGMIIPDVSGNK